MSNPPQPIPIITKLAKGFTGVQDLELDLLYLLAEIGRTSEHIRCEAVDLINDDIVKHGLHNPS